MSINFPYKICIPYKNLSRGGMYTFFGYFRKFLDQYGIEHTDKMYSNCDCMILNSFMTPFYKIKLKKMFHPRTRIVHRIDGAAQDYGRGAEWDTIQKKVNGLVDLTIFQSCYGRKMTHEHFQCIPKDGPVIYNPIDTNLFRPQRNIQAKMEKPKVAYVTFSTNKKKGLNEFIEIANVNQDLNFVMIGNCPEELKTDRKNIEFTGQLGRAELAEKLSICHYFLFFSQNETCPNVVLEALASGLVVLYLDSGGTKELVGNTGFSVTTDTFRQNLDESWKNWESYSKLSRERAVNEFSLDNIFSKYLDSMKKILENQK